MLDQLNSLKLLFLVLLDISDLYLFHLIVLLNPVFSCCNRFLLPWAEKVTTGTYNSWSVILNVTPVGEFIAGFARFSPCVGTAVYVVILVKTQF